MRLRPHGWATVCRDRTGNSTPRGEAARGTSIRWWGWGATGIGQYPQILEPSCRGSLLETLPAGTAARCGQDRDDMPLPIGSATTKRCWSKRYGSWTDQSMN